MMFSATFLKNCRDLAREHVSHDHVRIRVGRAGSSHSNIKQDVVFTEASAKRQALEDLLFTAPPCRTIIFVNSKRAADEVDDYLFNKGFPCTSIHGNRTQREREDSIRAFRSGKAPILIATGVSARGLDIHNVMHGKLSLALNDSSILIATSNQLRPAISPIRWHPGIHSSYR
jgi:ATP-dependent RNA helicase DDX3X